MTMLTLYGIPNCDTVKKARLWLDAHGTAYAFHDYKKAGVDEDSLRRWIAALGWEAVLNRAGTTFRKLPDADRTDLDADKAVALMLAQPSTIKRPIVEGDGILLAGFKPEVWDAVIG
ncbi:ArsC family reductase [Sphingomonas bacterium]|uniref:ArsC family reductase n=1 Tax=Sphingomonas bacterium TaxID=1895847 RepID=UPI00262C71C0|nr:ArsC family reductase [Sphingomonas bacterium]MDB5679979.1 arsenate reductase [Sphingomonas bacterium]